MTAQTEPSGAPPEILIVEDSPVEAELLRRILVRAGYRVPAVAKNGEEGLQALREHPCALVMSDINMPLMDGYELCRAIKLDDKVWNTQVILVTMLSEPKDIIMALDVGADGYITKPYVEANLLNRISVLLANPIRRKFAEERRKVRVEYLGKEHDIAVGGQQMSNLLFSVYEHSQMLNQELMQIQNQLNLLNENLDKKVRERTEALAEATAEARQKTEQVRMLFENNADGIIVIGRDGRILSANPAAAQLFGQPLDALLGTDFGMPVTAGETTEIVIPSGGKAKNVGMRCADTIWEGRPAYLATLRDITERKQAEATLKEQLNELKRWHDAMQGREMRVVELKREVNELLVQAGQAPRYASVLQAAAEGALRSKPAGN